MAQKEKKLDYIALTRTLHAEGPGRLYLLWGEEDFLREKFAQELRRACLGDNDDGFDYKRFDGAAPDPGAVQEAADTMPFFAEHVYIELRGFDLNKCKAEEAERFKAIFAGLPEQCTVAIILPPDYEPDGRLSLCKTIRKYGSAIRFTAQEQQQLLRWIARRVEADGKKIGHSEAEYLVFNCGELMTHLANEISKLTHYVSGEMISRADIDTVTDRSTQASVFQMTDALAVRDFDTAARILAELLGRRENPILLLAVIGRQFRQLLAARTAQDYGLGSAYVTEVCGISLDFIARKLMDAARGFRTEQLARAVSLCAETDYAMKSSASDDEELLVNLLLELAAGGAA